jgi:hypothetical protein
MNLTDQQLHTLAERKRGWPWNGFELIQDKKRRQALTSATSFDEARPVGILKIPSKVQLTPNLANQSGEQWRLISAISSKSGDFCDP